MHFYYSRTNLDGDVLAQGVIETPRTESYGDLSECAVSKEANGRAIIWSFAKSPRAKHNSTELILIYYNFQENRLEIRAHMVDESGLNVDTITHSFYWKDAAYYLDCEDEYCKFRVLDLQNLTCRDAKIGLPVDTDENCEPFLLGDGTFLISTFVEGFRVWCFDKNVQLFKLKYRS